jgi:hypothetical protein
MFMGGTRPLGLAMPCYRGSLCFGQALPRRRRKSAAAVVFNSIEGAFAFRWSKPVARTLLALILVLASLAPALAELRIKASAGGYVLDYVDLFSRVRQSGERVVIDGPCLSACTLVLSTIPHNRICVTRRAVLGFHAPTLVDRETGRSYASREATRVMTAAYPPEIRAWLKKRGGLKRGMILLRGRELSRLYRRCV